LASGRRAPADAAYLDQSAEKLANAARLPLATARKRVMALAISCAAATVRSDDAGGFVMP
jgi:hypothetical protein